MDIEEFKKQVQPAGKRSQLDPFKAQIFALKEKGYTNQQVRDFLKANDVSVSLEAVRKYINSRSKDAPITSINEPQKATKIADTPNPVSTASKPVEAPKNEPESVGDNDEVEAYISPKKRREQNANRFITNEDNPLLKRNKD